MISIALKAAFRCRPSSNIPEHISCKEHQIAENEDNKPAMQWWRREIKPVNQTGKDSQYHRHQKCHLLGWREWPIEHEVLPLNSLANAVQYCSELSYLSFFRILPWGFARVINVAVFVPF